MPDEEIDRHAATVAQAILAGITQAELGGHPVDRISRKGCSEIPECCRQMMAQMMGGSFCWGIRTTANAVQA